jgi:TPR repeat protein
MRGPLLAMCLLTGIALSLNACVTGGLPGISEHELAANQELKELKSRAFRHQDKHAQLELGIRYEYGRGVPVNWKAAAQLYAQAAKGNPGGIMGWSGLAGAPGSIPMDIEPRRKGLPEAKKRLEALRARMKAAGYKCDGVGWNAVFCRE